MCLFLCEGRCRLIRFGVKEKVNHLCVCLREPLREIGSVCVSVHRVGHVGSFYSPPSGVSDTFPNFTPFFVWKYCFYGIFGHLKG